MVNRLRLNHLTFIGANVPPATVEFGPGTTVVRGPSDTGKSFIVDGIDFLLGAKALREIPQRARYFTALLGLTLPSGERVTLARPISGGVLGLYPGDLRTGPLSPAPRTLGSQHSAKNNTNLSRYLLQQIGLDQKRVRKNAQNQTHSLSFRNIALLCVVGETAMQSETAPALTGNAQSRTKEISTLKLLLQNEDDSAIVAVESSKERRRAATAKAEVLDELLADLRHRIRVAEGPAELRARLDRLESAVTRHSTSISVITAERSIHVRQLVNADRLAVMALSEVGQPRSPKWAS
ncbi:hypothetical protein [Saccharopolyspora sp. NPDC003762]